MVNRILTCHLMKFGVECKESRTERPKNMQGQLKMIKLSDRLCSLCWLTARTGARTAAD